MNGVGGSDSSLRVDAARGMVYIECAPNITVTRRAPPRGIDKMTRNVGQILVTGHIIAMRMMVCHQDLWML